MKILILLHDLVMGGTTINAIELGTALRDRHGHEVVLFATPGPMTPLVDRSGLRLLPAPIATAHPSPARMQALREAVRRERPDLIYAWEAWTCIDAYYAAHLPMGVPMLVTDMTMQVTRLLPRELVTTFGTPDLVAKARAAGRHRAELLLPPVDHRANARAAVDPTCLRQRCGIGADDITLVTVSRLAESMKGESLLRTLDAVRTLGRELPLRLLIVGDGSARGDLEHEAARVNAELGRPAAQLIGAMLDPRPAYAAADIVIGMGGSALRGLAFGKAVIVVGERGFSAPFAPNTAEHFYRHGFYGLGRSRLGEGSLGADIHALAQRRDTLTALGEFSRQFVAQRFSLDLVSARLSQICVDAVTHPPRYPRAAMDALRTTAVYLRERRFLWRVPAPAPMESADA